MLSGSSGEAPSSRMVNRRGTIESTPLGVPLVLQGGRQGQQGVRQAPGWWVAMVRQALHLAGDSADLAAACKQGLPANRVLLAPIQGAGGANHQHANQAGVGMAHKVHR